jgi:hypothetical protein
MAMRWCPRESPVARNALASLVDSRLAESGGEGLYDGYQSAPWRDRQSKFSKNQRKQSSGVTRVYSLSSRLQSRMCTNSHSATVFDTVISSGASKEQGIQIAKSTGQSANTDGLRGESQELDANATVERNRYASKHHSETVSTMGAMHLDQSE